MRLIFISIGIWLMLGCNSGSGNFHERMAEVRSSFASKAAKNNAIALAEQKFLDSIYTLADTNLAASFAVIDSILRGPIDPDIDPSFYYIKGEIYYHRDSFERAIEQFTKSAPEYNNCYSCFIARACAYMKMDSIQQAYIDLMKAVNISTEGFQYLANYFEVTGNIDSSLKYYNKLYLTDTIYYKAAYDRIQELQRPSASMVKELKFPARNRLVLLLEPV